MFICKICKKEFKKARDLSNHIRIKHLISNQEYYDRYLLEENFNDTCIICQSEKKRFLSLTKGYSQVCINQSCMGKYVDSTKSKKTKQNNNTYLDIKCQICGKELKSILSLSAHLFGHSKNSCHNNTIKSPQDYYNKYLIKKDEKDNIICPICKKNEKSFKGLIQGYNQTCKNRSCIGKYGNQFIKNREIRKIRNYSDPIECKICNIICEGKQGLFNHLIQKHDISLKQYYDQYLKVKDEDKCKYCNQPTKYQNFTIGYHPICSSQNCINQLIIETKTNNGTLNNFKGYSKYPVENIFQPIYNQINTKKSIHVLFGENEFFQNVKDNKKCKKYNFNVFFYDFCITDKKYKPLLICEFNGNEFHIRPNELLKKRHDKDFFGNSLLNSYRKDYFKKKVILEKYPDCKYIIIWEDDIQTGIDILKSELKMILTDKVYNLDNKFKSRKHSSIPLNTKCEICGSEFRGLKGLGSHLRQRHNYNQNQIKEYYDKYLLDESLICPICKQNKKKFIGLTYGYTSTCVDFVLNCRYKWMNQLKNY